MSPNTFQSVVLCEGVTPDPFRLRVSNPVGTALLFQKPLWVNTHNASTQKKGKPKWIAKKKKEGRQKRVLMDRHTKPEQNPNDLDDFLR
jgi:hypothetical protein